MNILICDDDREIVRAIEIYLKNEGYRTLPAYDGLQALQILEQEPVHLVIMDIMMPGMDGLSVTEKIRATRNVPIILLSAKSEDYDKIQGLNLGADDYVTKPFSNRELMMRVRSLIRRSSKTTETVLEAGRIKINVRAHRVILDGKEVDLSPKEYDLLMFFWENCDIALSREKIIDKIWGYDYYGDMRTIDTHIKRLRSKIKDSGCEIQTVRGVGYRFYINEDAKAE